jgi:orotate phosphoribosyltransferase
VTATSAARETAEILWSIGAVNFRPAEPYTLASGLLSPSYIDCRKIISHPKERGILMDHLARKIRATGVSFDNIAGGETAGIPFAALIAERLGLPMTYVRKKPKGYGRNARIEGEMTSGQNVLLVEDLATDGGSKFSFAEAIRETGAGCAHVAVIFFYGIFPGVAGRLAAAGLTLHALATWADVLAVARDQGRFDTATLTSVETFLADPLAWSAARGKKADLPERDHP